MILCRNCSAWIEVNAVIPLKWKYIIKGGYHRLLDFGPEVAASYVRTVWEEDSLDSVQKHNAEILKYLEREYSGLLEHYRDQTEPATGQKNAPIWMLWWDGAMPDIIKLCYRSKLHCAGDHPVILLTKDNARDYVSFPDCVWAQFESGQLRIQHLADMIRVQLIRKYGGLWLDASIYCAGAIPEEYFQMPLYSIKGNPDPRFVSNNQWTTFAIGGWADNVLCAFLDDFFQEYCRRGKSFIDYFMFDCAIALAYRHIPAVRESLDRLPREERDTYWLNAHLEQAVPDFREAELPLFSKIGWSRLRDRQPTPGTLYEQLLTEYGLYDPRVSIIVPVYNVEKYLPECLDSVQKQNYVNWEVLLVDDGSTDGSGRICDEYAARDPRFRVIHQANAGAANAKNTGLDHVSGAYVTFLDSDDWVEPDWLETLVVTAKEQQADVVECDFQKEYIGRSEIVNNWNSEAFSAETYLAQYLSNWTCSLFWNKLYRADLIKDIRFRRERRCIDDEFFTYKVVSGAGKIARSNMVLYHYRHRASSAVFDRDNRLQKSNDSLEILIERYQWICQRFLALRPVYLKHDVEIMFFFAEGFDFDQETVEKFRRVTKFYLKESILHYCGRVNLLYALRLQMIPTAQLLQEKEFLVPASRDECFP